MYAIKANRQYKIEPEEKQRYIDLGYKIAEFKDDKLVYEEVETEESKKIAELEKEIAKLEKENEKLEKERHKLNANLEKLSKPEKKEEKKDKKK